MDNRSEDTVRQKTSPRALLAKRHLTPGVFSRRVFFILLWGVLALAFFPDTFKGLLTLFFSSNTSRDIAAVSSDNRPDLSNIQTEASLYSSITDMKKDIFSQLDEIERQFKTIQNTKFSSGIDYIDFKARDRERWAEKVGFYSPGKRFSRFLRGSYRTLKEKIGDVYSENIQFDISSWSSSLLNNLEKFSLSHSDEALYFGRPFNGKFKSHNSFYPLPWIESYAQSNQLIEKYYEDFSF
jgi:hypothetical protein